MELRPEQALEIARALHLEVTPEDLHEVTYRLNAVYQGLVELEVDGLDNVESVPVFWLREG